MMAAPVVLTALEISVCAAVMAGRRMPFLPGHDVFKGWSITAPTDGLGFIGLMLHHMKMGDPVQAKACLDRVQPEFARYDLAQELAEDVFKEDQDQAGPALPAGPASLRR